VARPGPRFVFGRSAAFFVAGDNAQILVKPLYLERR